MIYKKIVPSKELQNYVHYFWVLKGDAQTHGVRNFKILPDGIPTLVYQEEPQLFYDRDSGFLPQFYLYGQFTKFSKNWVNRPFQIIGVYLKPTAIKAIFGVDAHEMLNRNIPLEELITSTTLEELQHAETIARKIEIISSFLIQQIQHTDYIPNRGDTIIHLLKEGKELKEIQQLMNLSERSLERWAKIEIGMSPKTSARIIRFQSSLDLIRQQATKNLTQLAYQSGYFDQSHYIREFKIFTGVTPKVFKVKANEELENYPQWEEEKQEERY